MTDYPANLANLLTEFAQELEKPHTERELAEVVSSLRSSLVGVFSEEEEERLILFAEEHGDDDDLDDAQVWDALIGTMLDVVRTTDTVNVILAIRALKGDV